MYLLYYVHVQLCGEPSCVPSCYFASALSGLYLATTECYLPERQAATLSWRVTHS